MKRWRSTYCSVWAVAMTNRCSIRRNLDIEDRLHRKTVAFQAVQESITSFFGCFKFQYWCHRDEVALRYRTRLVFHLCEVRSLLGSRIRYSFLPSIFHTRLDKHRGRKEIRIAFFLSNVCVIYIYLGKGKHILNLIANVSKIQTILVSTILVFSWNLPSLDTVI